MTQEIKKIEAKVVSIISSEKIVINKGKRDGVEIGMPFLVYRLGETIIDPDTNENLGQLEIIVGRGRAAHIQERLTTIFADDKAGGGPLENIAIAFSQIPPSINGFFDSPALGDYAKSI